MEHGQSSSDFFCFNEIPILLLQGAMSHDVSFVMLWVLFAGFSPEIFHDLGGDCPALVVTIVGRGHSHGRIASWILGSGIPSWLVNLPPLPYPPRNKSL